MPGTEHRKDLVKVHRTERPTTGQDSTSGNTPIGASADGPVPATVRIAVGETYDFVYDAPPGPASLWLEVRTSSGRWQAQGQVIVK